ncbi:hypothetical protein [Vibrio sp. Y29_XK_CS5]|uniref:hypothetical protein n=1 Tax=Vibrio sp. Y29_XK_CS5 TaxID=2957762 RepID=UPI0020A5EFE6|nr:hypothetical protein [Vibrio sp. Y29_XK_CS5]
MKVTIVSEELILYRHFSLNKKIEIEKYTASSINTFINKNKNTDICIVDYSQDLFISLNDIYKLKEKSKKLICLIPLSNAQILRTIPYYIYHQMLSYPFNLFFIENFFDMNINEFQFTRQLMNLRESESWEEIVNLFNDNIKNEDELLCFYEAFYALKSFDDAEKIREKYYKENKIPTHPEIKMLSILDKIDCLKTLKDIIRMEINFFLRDDCEQLIIDYLNIPLENTKLKPEYKISKLIKSPYFNIYSALCETVETKYPINKNLVLMFIYQRKFNLFPFMNKTTQTIVLLISINNLDIDALKFIKKNKLKLSYIMQKAFYRIIGKLTKNKKNLQTVFTSKLTLRKCEKYSKVEIYNSVFFLTLKTGNEHISLIRETKRKLDNKKIINIYLESLSLRKEFNSKFKTKNK